MKTHQLASQLEELARLLRKLPDIPAHEAVHQVLTFLEGATAAKSRPVSRPSELPQGAERRLLSMSSAEIEDVLNSSEEFATTANVAELASRLHLTSSKRQNRKALVNMIVRHFEARQMDAMIRTPRGTETLYRQEAGLSNERAVPESDTRLERPADPAISTASHISGVLPGFAEEKGVEKKRGD